MVIPVRHPSHVSIVVDSAASLPSGMVQESGFHVVPMTLNFGEEIYADGCDLSPTEFYSMLKKSQFLPTTSAPSPARFMEAFRRAAQDTMSVLCLTVGSHFSSSFDSAMVAAREAEEVLPDLRVSILDTQSAAGGEGLVALEAWRASNKAQELKEVVATAHNVIARVKLLAFVDTLYYLWKGGRVPRIAYEGASILRVKPIFELSQGRVSTVARPRTHKRAVERLIALMHQSIGSESIHATVMHANAFDAAEELRCIVESEFDCREMFISEFSAVMGAHIGPGLLGVAFWSHLSE